MATRRKSVKNETAKPENEEAAAELPGMEADKDGDAATRKSGETPKETRGGPRVHLPNLVCVRYYGAEPWTLREAVKMPYPELSPGDVVVTDRKTAKWLTRKGMPFQIVECGETLRVTSETADAEG